MLQTNGLAVACFVLGLVSTVTMFWCFPISIPCGIVAVVLYANARRNPVQQGLATAGLVHGDRGHVGQPAVRHSVDGAVAADHVVDQLSHLPGASGGAEGGR